MSKPWVERRGGIWLDRAQSSDKLVAEDYDEEQDAFILIWQRASDGHFQVEYLVKGSARRDPQWSLPFWGNIAGQGIYGTLVDACAHLKAIANEHHRRVADAKLFSQARQPIAGNLRIQTDGNGSARQCNEHFELALFRQVEGAFDGVVGNEPKPVCSVTSGWAIRFNYNEISDSECISDSRQVRSATV